MALEDVVHVLRKVHKALRRRGVLLDVQPVPGHPWVEVWRNGVRTRLGHLDDTMGISMIKAARSRLAIVERERLFTVRGRRFFDWRVHCSGVEDWFRRREEHGSTSLIPPALLRRIRREMRFAGTTLVLGERIRATTMTKTIG